MSEHNLPRFSPGDVVVVKVSPELGPTKHLTVGQRYIVRQLIIDDDPFLVKTTSEERYNHYVYLEGVNGGWQHSRFERVEKVERKFRMIRLPEEV